LTICNCPKCQEKRGLQKLGLLPQEKITVLGTATEFAAKAFNKAGENLENYLNSMTAEFEKLEAEGHSDEDIVRIVEESGAQKELGSLQAQYDKTLTDMIEPFGKKIEDLPPEAGLAIHADTLEVFIVEQVFGEPEPPTAPGVH
jgi:hypothetical protein